MQPGAIAVFAYLAIARPNGWHQRDRLLGIFWPDLDAEHARPALRKALQRIREVIGEDVLISHGADTVQLSPEHFQCDARLFNSALAGNRLRECLDIYQGELLPGFYGSGSDEFERWLAGEREFYQQQAVTAAWRLVEFYEANKEYTSATQLARSVARLASTDERILRRVITMMDRLGDRAGAVAVYQKFADDLWRQFQTRPSLETMTLVASFRA